MGREVRKVLDDWEHPRDSDGGYVPLFDGATPGGGDSAFEQDAREYVEMLMYWARTGHNAYRKWRPLGGKLVLQGLEDDGEAPTFKDFIVYHGPPPRKADYMPFWPPDEEYDDRMRLVMYETCSGGTPISPKFKTAEELAEWLAVSGASAFADMTATKEQWLAMIEREGGAVSALVTIGEDGRSEIVSGVAAAHEHSNQDDK